MRRRAGLALACAALAAGCGSQAATTGSAGPAPVTAPLATSLVTAQGSWAVTVMGGSAATHDNFWQLFVRPAGASRWSLATPPGVADNGGLVTAGAATSLVVGFRPSLGLTYSPLAASTDAGRTWTTGLLDAALADVPDALAVAPSGRALALTGDGTVETAGSAAAAAAGQWSRLASLRTLASAAVGRSCGLVALSAVSFGSHNTPMTAGSCARRGVAGVFAEHGGTWQAAGPALPARFGADQVQMLRLAGVPGGAVAVLLAGTSLLAAWQHGAAWSVSAPAAAGAVRASGFGPGGSVWLLLGGGRAETAAGPGAAWRPLPAVPAGTATLAAGPGWLDALAVEGARLTVYQMAGSPAGSSGWAAYAPPGGRWVKEQVINVPIQYGSSG
ncbi:MAG: hypothetical protein JO132_15160 [Streptosporangiaceae bacterium]|nr:hypothetical protein [Streptosporangiaceae bacterium]